MKADMFISNMLYAQYPSKKELSHPTEDIQKAYEEMCLYLLLYLHFIYNPGNCLFSMNVFP